MKALTTTKKAISIIMAGVLMCGAFGCAKDDSEKATTTAATDTSTTPVETTTAAPVPLAAPANLTVTSSENCKITLKWDKVDNATSYAVYRSQYAEDYKAFNGYDLIAITADTTYCDTYSNTTSNISWYYKVQAITASADYISDSSYVNNFRADILQNTVAAGSTFANSALSSVAVSEVTSTITRQPAENLTDRAVIGIDLAGDKGAEVYVGATDAQGNEYTKGVYLSWRAFEDDPEDVSFDVYRNGELVADDIKVTNLIDENGKYGDTYKVVGSSDAALGLKSLDTAVWENYYLELNLNKPADMALPMKKECTYYSNDLSVADLDNDGQLELIVSWKPDNQQDNTGGVVTGYTYLDAYDVDFNTGAVTQMWRIDLGPNIRSGAHYVQYLVWDMDGDGIAELGVKTADGSTTYKCVNGELVYTGHVGACRSEDILQNKIGKNDNDYRGATGMILNGPEYLTIFKGDTGEIIDTVEYTPGRGTINEWGDGGGNRCDRFLACVAYLDGEKPSMVFTRGYYAKTALTAYQLVDGKLKIQWTFNSDDIMNGLLAEFEANYNDDVVAAYEDSIVAYVEKYKVDRATLDADDIKEIVTLAYKGTISPEYTGQGNHNLSVADVDNDGKDEIIFGSMVVDNDGTQLYSTGLGHGDALHVGDFVESNEGLEVFQVQENSAVQYVVDMRDAETGKILYGKWVGKDNGRGLTADIDPRYVGSEMWSAADGNIHAAESTVDKDIIITGSRPSINFDILWDGDLLSETQDHNFNSSGYYPVSTIITNYNYETGVNKEIFNSKAIFTNNGSKGNLGLVADIIGDWREEIVSRASADASIIRIYMSTIPTTYVIPCLLEDDNYRLGVAWQNVGYNQPTHLSYSLTEGLRTSEVTATAEAGKIIVNFTDASDGVYGGTIEGYELYCDEGFGSYMKFADIPVGTNTYTINTLSAGTKYKIKIAAVVNGETSHFSFPVTVTSK